MPEPRVVVAGVTLRGRRLSAVGAASCHLVTAEENVLAGAGAIGAVAAAGTSRSTGVHVDLVTRVGEDPAGTWALAELIGRGVDVSRLSRWGETGESLVLEAPTGEEQVVLHPGPVDTDGVDAAVRACRPGDVLLVDACVLARHPEVVDVAYDSDLQIVADLTPLVPGVLDAGVAARIDVAVVDAPGAGTLADAATAPASVAAYAGELGAWWDDLRYVHPEDGASPGASDDGVHRFAGALAAALASGMDRPEAFTAAVAVALRRIEA